MNSRPVGEVHLGTSPFLGPSVARVTELRIDEPDRRRGRGTVAMLAAEEVARGWGCRQIELTLPAGNEAASRLADALGYVPRNRGMRKRLGDEPRGCPPGSTARPMTEAEFAAWQAADGCGTRGSGSSAACPRPTRTPRPGATTPPSSRTGSASEGTWFGVLEHEGTPVGHVWLGRRDGGVVYDVQTEEGGAAGATAAP